MSVPEEDHDLSGVLDQFRWSLQALAANAEVQRSLFPGFVCKAEELALDFGQWSEVALRYFEVEDSGEHIEAIRTLDQRLDAMGLQGVEFDEALWREEALEDRPQWEEVRKLAKLALSRFGWIVETPPYGRSIYAPGRPLPS